MPLPPGHTSASIASQTEAQKQESVRISALRALQCERSILVPLRAAHPGEEIVWGKPLELAVASRGLGSAFPLAGFDDGDNYTENRRVEMRLIAPGEEGYYAPKPPPLKAAGTRRRSSFGRRKKTEEEEVGQTRGDPNLRFKLVADPDRPVIDQLREQMRSKGLRARELFSDIDENIVRPALALDPSTCAVPSLSLLPPRLRCREMADRQLGVHFFC